VAHALVDEGMSHADIARLFGVSRQRVGMLLRPDDSGEAATAVAGANADRSDFPTTSDSPV
jgi:predicted transcriptional regulator